MKNMIMFFMFILCIYSICGMDSFSEDSDSSNALEKKHLTAGYIKQNLEFDNAYDQRNIFKKNSDVTNLSKVSELKFDETNNLKRKHKSNKSWNDPLLSFDEQKYNRKCKHNVVRACEFCQNESTHYTTGKFSGQTLCKTCYDYESRYGYLVPLDERKKLEKHKDNILVCEFCQKDSIRYITGKVSGKSLCRPCYMYEYNEYQRGHLIFLDKQEKFEQQKKNKRACEFCQKESKKYKKGRVSGISLCTVCYEYESRHVILVPREKRVKHNGRILVCEFCQQESSNKFYITGKFSGKSLCSACYIYEIRHGYLEERKKPEKYKDHIFACEFCEKESIRYIKSKYSDKVLCLRCYQYESRTGLLVPIDKRNRHIIHKDILVCEVCQKESIEYYTTGKISGKSLCKPCYMNEYQQYQHDYLASRDDRENYEKQEKKI